MSYCINPQCQNPQNPTHAITCQGCGSELRLKNRYRVMRVLGQSHCHRTFLAIDEDKPTQPRCVIKQCLDAPLSIPQASVEFRLYTQTLDQISQHPALPELLACFEDHSYSYLVQDYIPGRNLAEELEQEGVFSELQIWDLLNAILPVLELIHNKNRVHGDIKPENIIRRPILNPNSPTKKQLVLVDFAGVNPLQGSAEYVSPEQLQGEISPKNDLYSLGVTCLHLLTQISPFDLWNIKTNSWVWKDYLKTPISHRLTRILNRLIERDPVQRYTSAADVIQDLKSGPILVKLSQIRQHPWILTALGGAVLAMLSLFLSSRVPQPNSEPIEIEPIYQIPDISVPPPENFNPIIPQSPPAMRTLVQNIGPVWSVAISPDGQSLATGSWDHSIKLWDLNELESQYFSNTPAQILLGHGDKVQSVAFSPDGQTLASGDFAGTVKLWQVDNGGLVGTFKGHRAWVNVAFNPRNHTLVSGSFDDTLKVWQLLPSP